MRALYVRYQVVRSGGDEGWVLMDAIWSAVVVVLAFMATFMALESGTRTATKDIHKTTAYDIAQNEINGMRNIAKKDLNALLAMNNTNSPPNSPSKTVTLGGQQYGVWYKAYYVTGLGDNATDACGGSYGANGSGTAKFIFIKATVGYPGIRYVGTTPSSPLPALDSFYAPEGGDPDAATGTLRVYVLDRNDAPYVGNLVSLEATGPGMSFSTQTKTTGANGCVLFTGLPRGSFNINVATSKYDIYVNNPTGSKNVTPINLPSRAAMSKDIRLEDPIKVMPTFWSNKGSGASNDDFQVTPSNSANLFLSDGGASDPIRWVARSSKIISASPPDFVQTPGTSFMPHNFLGNGTARINYMFPDPGGYDIFGGACEANEPNEAPLRHIPTSSNGTWTPGGTYSEAGVAPKIYLPQLRTRVYASASNPGDDLVQNQTIANSSGKVAVRLRGKIGEDLESSRCGGDPDLFGKWVRLKGTTDSSGYLSDMAEVLPEGRYEVCVRATAQWQYRTKSWSWWSGWSYSSWRTQTETRYVSVPITDLDSTKSLSADFFGTDASTTDCSGGIASWS